MTTKIYTLKELADELARRGCPRAVVTIKKHIYVTKRLEGFGRVLGTTTVFTEDEIEPIKAILESTKDGRPDGAKDRSPRKTPLRKRAE